jgi:hypothetical protein
LSAIVFGQSKCLGFLKFFLIYHLFPFLDRRCVIVINTTKKLTEIKSSYQRQNKTKRKNCLLLQNKKKYFFSFWAKELFSLFCFSFVSWTHEDYPFTWTIRVCKIHQQKRKQKRLKASGSQNVKSLLLFCKLVKPFSFFQVCFDFVLFY